MIKLLATLTVAIFASLAIYCFYEEGIYVDMLLASNPKAPDQKYAEKISLHQGSIPVTHDQHMHHMVLELGAYGSVLICGLIVISVTRKRDKG